MKRTATAVWTGGFKQGKGSLTTSSGTLKDTPYSFTSRFENGAQTNPEELIAAAHAGCFTMALSVFLERAGFVAEKLSTQAILDFDKVGEDWTIVGIQLVLEAKVPGIDSAKFKEIATTAKEKCPVSRLLNTKISLESKLNT